MAGRWLDLRWALSVLCVLLMAETVSGARDSSTGAHVSPQFPASGVNQTPVVDCRKVCGLNVSDRCDFIRTNPDCRSDGGYLDYLEGIFCHFPPNLLPLAVTLYVSWLLYLFLILGVTAAKFFCPNLSAISTTLKLSHNVAGVTFLAFGNGAPDIFSALVAFSDPHTAGLALGALFGAGVLVTTVVAGGITILHPFMAASRPFFRDIVFYMVAVFLTFIMLFRGRVTMAWALGYLGLYVFYVVTVILCTWIYRWQRRGSLVYSMPVTPEILSDSEEDRVSSNSNSYDYGDEYRPLLFYQETTAQILARALNPLDYMKWRRKSAYWKALKVFKLPVEFLLLLTVPVVDPDKDDRNWKRPLNCLHLVISPLVVVLTLQSGTSLCFPGLSDQRSVDQRGRHRGGEHLAVPGRGLPAEQHCARAHAAGLGEQHWRCLLGFHAGPPGLPADGVLRLLWRYHLQHPCGRGAGLPAPDLPEPHGGEAGARWTAGVGPGRRPGAQPRLLPGLSPIAMLPAQQSLRHLPAPLLPELPCCGPPH
ncbi:mitochondrial sodium/calcium exchanger protein isoform X3 [Piliocolobus tephrosceles]|uniref:mitochondrial sodium/calcium exchanger protein isoform X3 n=1 Tax=Piliocolobus tephrosceles TaxID=591936 RepID=UPI000C29E420|nr:mitochondrial sodium/calcium exchanger protein isoform X3 [Piliocolobus tephrosceles]